MTREELLVRFRAKASKIAAAKAGVRYRCVVGKLKRARLLDAPDVPEYGGPVELEAVLWAGTLEPRILEVLPALMLRRPKFLRNYGLPDDLEKVLIAIRNGRATEPFRGVAAQNYLRWVNKKTSVRLKTFRLHSEDILRLQSLKIRLGETSETAVLRRALIALDRNSK
jgi:hypothetical protein